jgi:hypothetical protein
MKLLLISMGAGFVLLQFAFLLALLAAARKPTPKFEPAVPAIQPEYDGNHALELVA